MTQAYRLVDLYAKAWDELDAIIHEWHESALFISNPELEAAFNQSSDEEIALFPPQIENVAV